MGMILFLIIIGLLAGWVAKLTLPGNEPGGILGDFIVGIGGAVVGGSAFNVIFGNGSGGIIASSAVAFVVATALMLLARAVGDTYVSTR